MRDPASKTKIENEGERVLSVDFWPPHSHTQEGAPTDTHAHTQEGAPTDTHAHTQGAPTDTHAHTEKCTHKYIHKIYTNTYKPPPPITSPSQLSAMYKW